MRSFRLLCLTAVAACAAGASAVQVFAYDNIAATNNLISFDSATPGTVTVIGSSGVASSLMSGLDFSANGNLYGYAVNGAIGFYSVNKTTGAATLLANSGLTTGDTVNDLAWNPVTSQMLGVSSNTTSGLTNLYSFNLTTGAASLVGNVAGLTAANLIVGLAVNSTGTMFMHDIGTDQMFSVTGLTATAMGPEGILTNFSQGMTINWSGGNAWYHAAVVNSPATAVGFYTVNPTSGAATLVGNIGPTTTSFEPGDIAIAPVPEPASMAVLGIGAVAMLRRRRSKKA